LASFGVSANSAAQPTGRIFRRPTPKQRLNAR
jgi:hypothetical protein